MMACCTDPAFPLWTSSVLNEHGLCSSVLRSVCEDTLWEFGVAHQEPYFLSHGHFSLRLLGLHLCFSLTRKSLASADWAREVNCRSEVGKGQAGPSLGEQVQGERVSSWAGRKAAWVDFFFFFLVPLQSYQRGIQLCHLSEAIIIKNIPNCDANSKFAKWKWIFNIIIYLSLFIWFIFSVDVTSLRASATWRAFVSFRLRAWLVRFQDVYELSRTCLRHHTQWVHANVLREPGPHVPGSLLLGQRVLVLMQLHDVPSFDVF